MAPAVAMIGFRILSTQISQGIRLGRTWTKHIPWNYLAAPPGPQLRRI
jgi:hypothetical protein